MSAQSISARVLATFVLSFTLPAIAAPVKAVTKRGSQSAHFRTIDYGNEVFAVRTKVGRMLEIEFSKSETSIDFAMGDREAWSVKTVANVMFLKPKAEMADTNLRVITNKRKYWFDLVMTDDLKIVPYHIEFKYPVEAKNETVWSPDELKRREERLVDERLSAGMRAVLNKIGQGRPIGRDLNGNYDFIGPDELLPLSTYDDGEMTYVEFAPNNPMPVVFAVDEDGNESRVNFHVERDIFIVHRTAKRLIIRRGSSAGCLINASFRVAGAKSSYTSSQNVERKVKGDRDVPE